MKRGPSVFSDKKSYIYLVIKKSIMILTTAYDEIIDFIATGTTPEKVISFRSSEKAQTRVSLLLFKEKNTTLTSDEKTELDNYIAIEHLMRMAKARAFQIQSNV
jgi:hypothetical protein